jgi:hypothetical protein
MNHSSAGDPSGRRLARRRATLLAEAGRVARAVEVLLKRAGSDATACSDLIKHLERQEQIELQRAHGRIEPRKRFKKHSPQPLLEKRPRSLLYIDETGKSRLEPIVPSFFSLGAVALPEEEVDNYRAAADDIKLDFFGTTDITFHEPDMRDHDVCYYFGGDEKRQQEFDEAIDRLVADTKFVAFGVGVRKTAFEEEFVKSGVDPYLPTDAYALAIVMLLERYVDFLATSPTKRLARVTFESQGPREDAEHQLEYARTLLEGSQWVPDSAFRNWLEPGLRFTPKQGSDPMELADMLSRDVYEWIRGDCVTVPKRWDLLSRKIYCRGDGLMGKFGLKVFPDSDIRERIEEHRVRCGARPQN